MNQEFKEAFGRFSFLKVQDLITLFGICSLKSFDKGTFLAEQDKVCKYAYLIRKGIVRTYINTIEGEERTIRLAREKDFTSAGQSFLNGNPSTEFLEAIEDCKVVQIDIQKLNEIAKTNIRILRLSHEGIKEAFNEALIVLSFLQP